MVSDLDDVNITQYRECFGFWREDNQFIFEHAKFNVIMVHPEGMSSSHLDVQPRI